MVDEALVRGESSAAARRGGLGLALDGTRESVEAWVREHLRESDPRFELVLPLLHRRQAEGWTAYVIALLSEGTPRTAVDDFAKSLDPDTQPRVHKVDALELQDGLDMFYPHRKGAAGETKLFQSVEYVDSRPEAREDYYRIQTIFSGPAMRRLHERDRCGRFIGFEIVSCLYDSGELPPWDVVHVSGFSARQTFKAVPHFFRAFEDAARDIGRPSGREILRGWKDQRDKRTVRVRQLHGVTRQSDQRGKPRP